MIHEGLEYDPVEYNPLVTVPALPETLPVTLPVTAPVKSPVTLPNTLPVKFPRTLPVTPPIILAYIEVAVIISAAKLPAISLVTTVDGVLVDAVFNPSNKSASNPEPDPSTVLSLIIRSVAV